jgi:hypothetical protein
MLKILLVLLSLGTAMADNYNAEEQVVVLDTTRSRKTVKINLGKLDGVEYDDVAMFLIRPNSVNLSTFFVGKAMAVKVYNSTSVWYFTTLKDKKAVERGDKLLMFRKADITRGYRKRKYKRRQIVANSSGRFSPPGRQPDDPDGLSKKGKDWPKGAPLTESQVPYDVEVDLVDLSEIKKGEEIVEPEDLETLESVYITELQESPRAQEIEAKALRRFFQEATSSHVKKVNDKSFNVEEFYRDGIRDKDIPDVQEKSYKKNATNILKDARTRHHQRKQDIEEWISKRGKTWSQDMSDEDLSNFIEEYGIENERFRQTAATLHSTYHEFQGAIGWNIKDKSNHLDNNVHGTTFSLNLGYEYHLVKRYPPLKRFTVGISGRYSIDNLDLINKNGLYKEESLKLTITWYPFTLPSAIKTPIFFAGLGTRFGRAKIEATRLNLEGSYQVSGFPCLNFGLKYRHMSGFGYYGQFALEMIDLTLQDTELDATHPNELSFLDQKIELGLIYSF